MKYEDAVKIDNIIKWLETKDPNEEYKLGDLNNCLLAQYFRDVIPDAVSSGVIYGVYVDVDGELHGEQSRACWRVVEHPTGKGNTFGDALQRAYEYKEGE